MNPPFQDKNIDQVHRLVRLTQIKNTGKKSQIHLHKI